MHNPQISCEWIVVHHRNIPCLSHRSAHGDRPYVAKRCPVKIDTSPQYSKSSIYNTYNSMSHTLSTLIAFENVIIRL